MSTNWSAVFELERGRMSTAAIPQGHINPIRCSPDISSDLKGSIIL